MRRVIIESPLSGNFKRNIRYARLCCLDALLRGEAPYASHLLYTQMLDDEDAGHRRLGMEAGFAWGEVGELRRFCIDLGMSSGMEEGNGWLKRPANRQRGITSHLNYWPVWTMDSR